GFVYNGKAIPSLRGKYVFTDLTTGRIWWADYKDMLAADDGNPATLARIHEVKVRWNDPNDSPDAGVKTYDSMFPIVEAAYHARGAKMPRLATRIWCSAAAPMSASRSTRAASCICTARATACSVAWSEEPGFSDGHDVRKARRAAKTGPPGAPLCAALD